MSIATITDCQNCQLQVLVNLNQISQEADQRVTSAVSQTLNVLQKALQESQLSNKTLLERQVHLLTEIETLKREKMQLQAAAEAQKKQSQAELTIRENRVKQFIHLAEKEMIPLMKYFKGRSTIDPLLYSICDQAYLREVEADVSLMNAKQAELEAHGSALERLIQQLNNK